MVEVVRIEVVFTQSYLLNTFFIMNILGHRMILRTNKYSLLIRIMMSGPFNYAPSYNTRITFTLKITPILSTYFNYNNNKT